MAFSTSVVICLLTVGLGSILATDVEIQKLKKEMEKVCSEHKAKGRCNNPAIMSNCPQCGKSGNGQSGKSGGSGGSGQKKTTAAPTTRPPTTTRATTKKKCDKRSPCLSMAEANQRFKSRCVAAGLPCADSCRYDAGSEELQQVFRNGPCEIGDVQTYVTLAANGQNNEPCCQDTGVLSQQRTAVCGLFCNPTGGAWPQQKREALKYIGCVGVLQGIMQCHYYAEGAN